MQAMVESKEGSPSARKQSKQKPAKKPFGRNEFRAELQKLMPGYEWTVHASATKEATLLRATGTVSSGFNRLSSLSVVRTEREGEEVRYQVKSSGYGLRAPWLGESEDGTLARALRGLQNHYEERLRTYRVHAQALQQARSVPGEGA